ncbi:hypothetical protein SRHO_G00146690 [Serrasalmus rhombeus]
MNLGEGLRQEPIAVLAGHHLVQVKTWLNHTMPDSAFQLAGRQLFRADRNRLSGKARGGGLCVYINKVEAHCRGHTLSVNYSTMNLGEGLRQEPIAFLADHHLFQGTQYPEKLGLSGMSS